MGHAFFDDHIQITGQLEEWGTDEGVAMIIEEVLGGVPRPAPRAGTVDGILQKCSGDLDCAYDLGRLVAKRYRD